VRKFRIGVVIHSPLREQLFSKEDRARLDALGRVVWAESKPPITTEEAIGLLKDCEIGIGSWNTPKADAELLAGCPRLKLWEHAAGSVKHMFGPHLRGRPIMIASCSPAIAECVAQTVVGELIVGVKRVLENAAANRQGKAGKPANSRNISSSTVGVVAASQVGRNVIRLLRIFGATVLLYDPFVTQTEAGEMDVEVVKDLVDLCRRSDAVTLHTPHLPTTKAIVGLRELRAMKDDAVFINTSRGECVDEAALIGELQKGRLFAFLDVSFPEPAAADSPLRKLPNVVYTARITGMPDHKIGRQVVEDVQAYLAGGRPKMVVTEEMLERVA
jgi:phosphoglycerate dehydrogenase-like enzyme